MTPKERKGREGREGIQFFFASFAASAFNRGRVLPLGETGSGSGSPRHLT